MKICSNCNQENGDNSKFCKACGSKLEAMIVCQQCGEKQSEDAKFCPQCGTILLSERYPIQELDKEIEKLSQKICICESSCELNFDEIKFLKDNQIIQKDEDLFKNDNLDNCQEMAPASGKIFSLFIKSSDLNNPVKEEEIKFFDVMLIFSTLNPYADVDSSIKAMNKIEKKHAIAIIVPENWTKKEALINYFNLIAFRHLKNIYSIKEDLNSAKDVDELLSICEKFKINYRLSLSFHWAGNSLRDCMRAVMRLY